MSLLTEGPTFRNSHSATQYKLRQSPKKPHVLESAGLPKPLWLTAPLERSCLEESCPWLCSEPGLPVAWEIKMET